MTPQEQAHALLAPYDPDLAASILDSTCARELAASQLVPVLMTLMLHAKDIAKKALLDARMHARLSGMASECVSLNSSVWSSDDQANALKKAEATVREWMAPTTAPTYATGLKFGKVIGAINPFTVVEVEDTNQCVYCGRDIQDPTRLDYCSAICECSAMGEGA